LIGWLSTLFDAPHVAAFNYNFDARDRGCSGNAIFMKNRSPTWGFAYGERQRCGQDEKPRTKQSDKKSVRV